MKKVVLFSALLSLTTFSAYAHESGTAHEKHPETTKTKKSKKKKDAICKECGKPESKCECKGDKHEDHDHKEEHKEEKTSG